MLSTKLKEAAGNSADATLYVDDVFSTYLYTGNGSTQTITNGIDLAGKGGMVWGKTRNNNVYHTITDTVRGVDREIFPNSIDQQQDRATGTGSVFAFNSDGFSTSSVNGFINYSGFLEVAWTFRKAAKFFDVVTYTGDGTLNRQIPHSLGVVPGMIIIKRTDAADSWWTYHRGNTSPNANWWQNYLALNATSATTGNTVEFGQPTSSTITLDPVNPYYNINGKQFVAYLFAHDTSSTGIIQCGSFTTDGSGNATVNLGWEPQWLLVKNADGTSYNWVLMDTMRGWTANTASSEASLYPNTSGAENVQSFGSPTATGFNASGWYAGQKIIYMAIRRPNKPPTSGTQVYNAFLSNDSHPGGVPKFEAGFPVDLCMLRLNTNTTFAPAMHPRLTSGFGIDTNSTAAETTTNYSNVLQWDYSTGVGDSGTFGSSTPDLAWMFKRAPGFFDVVCYTGTGVATTQAHNLGVVPEMIIVKARSAATEGEVYVAPLGNDMALNLFAPNTGLAFTTGGIAWNYTTPTSSVFSLGTWNKLNGSGVNFVAYLFATLAGISKVGSYTGNGTGQAIACGFSAGARFVLIKRTDNAGGWYTFDSARGLTSGSSPYLLLNSTAAETTGNNGVYASTGGFTLGSTASTTTNISGASYIFLSVA